MLLSSLLTRRLCNCRLAQITRSGFLLSSSDMLPPDEDLLVLPYKDTAFPYLAYNWTLFSIFYCYHRDNGWLKESVNGGSETCRNRQQITCRLSYRTQYGKPSAEWWHRSKRRTRFCNKRMSPNSLATLTRLQVWRLDIFFLSIGFLGYMFKYIDQTNIVCLDMRNNWKIGNSLSTHRITHMYRVWKRTYPFTATSWTTLPHSSSTRIFRCWQTLGYWVLQHRLYDHVVSILHHHISLRAFDMVTSVRGKHSSTPMKFVSRSSLTIS